jgi:hypothetical protein
MNLEEKPLSVSSNVGRDAYGLIQRKSWLRDFHPGSLVALFYVNRPGAFKLRLAVLIQSWISLSDSSPNLC